MIWFLLSWVGLVIILCWWFYAANAKGSRVDEKPVARGLRKTG